MPAAIPLPYPHKNFTDSKKIMSEQYDEHEQSERVKQWLFKNGSNILTGRLLAVSAVAGWQWWQGRQSKQGQEAAGGQIGL